ncbi:MAG: hypothetical protein WDM79_18450 [Terricaulis sp.]
MINTTIYYEIGGFEARVSNRYRSDFLGEVTGFGAGRELRMVNGESVIDAQLGYRFGTGALEGLAVQFQANNVTDEPFSTYETGDERRVARSPSLWPDVPRRRELPAVTNLPLRLTRPSSATTGAFSLTQCREGMKDGVRERSSHQESRHCRRRYGGLDGRRRAGQADGTAARNPCR